jgi:hypothetical protein
MPKSSELLFRIKNCRNSTNRSIKNLFFMNHREWIFGQTIHRLWYTYFNLSGSWKCGYLYIVCSNPTNVVLLTVFGMVIGKGAWYRERQSWIRTRAIERTFIFKIHLGWKKNIDSLDKILIIYRFTLKSCTQKIWGHRWLTDILTS